jgi:hypothetical protein
MLSWMLYSIVVSLLTGLAALALERSAQIRRRPARWLWGACMAASLAILFIPARVSVQIPEATHADRATSSEILTPPRTSAIETSRFTLPIIGADQTPLSGGVSTLLDWTWRMASGGLALVILASGAHLSWRRRRWDRSHLAGTAVYISEDCGPAVVGDDAARPVRRIAPAAAGGADVGGPRAAGLCQRGRSKRAGRAE